jgi:hypothetical protein
VLVNFKDTGDVTLKHSCVRALTEFRTCAIHIAHSSNMRHMNFPL